MNTYEELRGTLLLAARIGRLCPNLLVQVAQVGFGDGQFPELFVEMVCGRMEVPTAVELESLRAKPHGAFDTIALRKACQDALIEQLCPEGYELRLQAKILQAG
jgi:hypothetical protein